MKVTNVLCGVAMVFVSSGANGENVFGIELPSSPEDASAIAYLDDDSGFAFKKWYGAFFFQERYVYDNPRLGYSLQYASPAGTDITVYVYSYGLDGILDGVSDPRVNEQLASAARALSASKRYSSVEALDGRVLSAHFLQASHELELENGARIKSYILVGGQDDHFLKLRVTGTSGALEPRVSQFIEQMLASLGVANN